MTYPSDLSTGVVARLTRIPQQTLIGWDRTGVLKAKPRSGRRAGAARRYDEDALIAALFAYWATRMAFKGDTLRQMIQLMQSGDRERLQRAALFSYRPFPGLVAHVFTPDVRSDDDRRYVSWLREQGRLVDGPTTLWETREAIRPNAHAFVTRGEEFIPPDFFEEER